MKDSDSDEMSCQCLHSDHKASDGITISKFIKGCCDLKYTELNNTSLLFKIQNDNKIIIDFHSISCSLNDIKFSNNSDNSVFQNLNFHPPKYDIPISVSSLLI